MDKSKQAKLVELRKKKAASKKQSEESKHSELLGAVNGLHALFESQSKQQAESTDKLINKLGELGAFKKEVASVKQAIQDLPKTENVSINNLSELIEAQEKYDNTEVVEAVKALTEKVENQTTDSVNIKNRKVEEFIPTRRVREVQGRLVYDDDPLQVSVVGGGGGTIASVQPKLIRDDAIAVVNPDGTNIGGGVDTSGLATTAKQDDIKNQLALKPGTDFDYIDGQQTSSTVDTYVYKNGGSGGTTVQTIVVTYTSSAKTDIDSVEYS